MVAAHVVVVMVTVVLDQDSGAHARPVAVDGEKGIGARPTTPAAATCATSGTPPATSPPTRTTTIFSGFSQPLTSKQIEGTSAATAVIQGMKRGVDGSAARRYREWKYGRRAFVAGGDPGGKQEISRGIARGAAAARGEGDGMVGGGLRRRLAESLGVGAGAGAGAGQRATKFKVFGEEGQAKPTRRANFNFQQAVMERAVDAVYRASQSMHRQEAAATGGRAVGGGDAASGKPPLLTCVRSDIPQGVSGRRLEGS